MRILDRLNRFRADRRGNFALYMALALMPILAGAGLAVDYSNMSRIRAELQNSLDAAVLAAAATDKPDREAAGKDHLRALTDAQYGLFGPGANEAGRKATFAINGDRVVGGIEYPVPMTVGALFFGPTAKLKIRSEARFSGGGGPCINILGNQTQALLLNSGAKASATKCEIHVQSTQNPALIANAGVTLGIAKLCLKGVKYIDNGAKISKFESGCTTASDAYAGKIPEPVVPVGCVTSGALGGSAHTLNPGVHCGTIFNGSPVVTFRPGLHIIKGMMILNAGSTIIANGVTFYFPDTDSEIRANGGLTMTATAPVTGIYKGVLMFERTSNAANNAQKRQYVFNGSLGERLEGVIYLPNRDVTYNSTTNVSASKINITANTMIMNSANWTFEPFEGGTGSGARPMLTQ